MAILSKKCYSFYFVADLQEDLRKRAMRCARFFALSYLKSKNHKIYNYFSCIIQVMMQGLNFRILTKFPHLKTATFYKKIAFQSGLKYRNYYQTFYFIDQHLTKNTGPVILEKPTSPTLETRSQKTCFMFWEPNALSKKLTAQIKDRISYYDAKILQLTETRSLLVSVILKQ